MPSPQSLPPLPYGMASFSAIRRNGFAYVDKTRFIETLEQANQWFVTFVRPRRFGKTLFTKVLQAYYDKSASVAFDQNFSGTYIHTHKTAAQGQFCVLRFNFSGISTKNIEFEFAQVLKDSFADFVKRYPNKEAETYLREEEFDSPSRNLNGFLSILDRYCDKPLFVIIDEYDQFANTLLANDPEQFRLITGSDGFLKNFYSRLKKWTEDGDEGNGGLVQRVFITGVSTISLDSMSSGFNIATDITQDTRYADMVGFNADELRELIARALPKDTGLSHDEIFVRMKSYYDGYRMSQTSDISVFNSSMCLYYLVSLQTFAREPLNMLDKAVGTDISKISNILALGDAQFVNDSIQRVVAGEPLSFEGFHDSINLNAKNQLDNTDVLSVLYYFGYLTYKEGTEDELVPPNKAVLSQFYDYWLNRLRSIPFRLMASTVRKALDALRLGDIRPLLNLVSQKLIDGSGLHALAHLNESSIQTAIQMALSLTSDYKVKA